MDLREGAARIVLQPHAELQTITPQELADYG